MYTLSRAAGPRTLQLYCLQEQTKQYTDRLVGRTLQAQGPGAGPFKEWDPLERTLSLYSFTS